MEVLDNKNIVQYIKQEAIQNDINVNQGRTNSLFNQIERFMSQYKVKQIGLVNVVSRNLIYIVEDNSSKKIVVKIRRETPSLSLEEELFYLTILEKKYLKAKQLLSVQVAKNFTVTIEEFIDGLNIHQEIFTNSDYMDGLIKFTSKFNTIMFEKVENINDALSNKKCFLHLLVSSWVEAANDGFNGFLAQFELNEKFNETEKDNKKDKYLLDNKSKVLKIKEFLEKTDFKQLIISLTPSNFNNYLALSHIDLHSGNLFLTKRGEKEVTGNSETKGESDDQGEFQAIDFDDISFNFIGYDLSHYIIEGFINEKYTKHPGYEFNAYKHMINDEQLLAVFDSYVDHFNRIVMINQVEANNYRKHDFKLEKFTIDDINKMFSITRLKGFLADCDSLNFEKIIKGEGVDYLFRATDELSEHESYIRSLKSDYLKSQSENLVKPEKSDQFGEFVYEPP